MFNSIHDFNVDEHWEYTFEEVFYENQSIALLADLGCFAAAARVSVLLHAQESCTETYGSRTQRFILATGSPGDPVLINTYHALCQPEGATAGQPVAAQFIDFVASEKGQTVIRNFGKDQFGEGLYNDAEYARQYDH